MYITVSRFTSHFYRDFRPFLFLGKQKLYLFPTTGKNGFANFLVLVKLVFGIINYSIVYYILYIVL